MAPTSRRSVRVAAALSLTALAGLSVPMTVPGDAVAAAPPRPNVLNIVLDDMRDDTLGRMKAYLPKTVKWFAPGTFYVNADVSTPSCCPSRATGMTGQYDHNNQMKHQHDIASFNVGTTVQHVLHASGYQTALVGKFLHDWPLTQAPTDFDSYAMWQTNEYRDPVINVGGTAATRSGYATTLAGNYALSFLRTMEADAQGRPWYEYVAIHAPHPDADDLAHPDTPYVSSAVRHCAAPHDPDVSDMAPYVKRVQKTVAQVEALCESQLRSLMSVDDQVDRLMTELQASGQLARTLVILWSDNGTMWGEHNRVSKFVPYLPSVNIPLFMRWDGHVPAGTNTGLVSNVDIAPTIYAATGVSPPSSVVRDGRSLLSAVTRTYQLNEYWLDSANGKVPDWAQLHSTHFAYIETYSATGALAFQEYYDLDADPAENHNLLKDADTKNPPAALIAGYRASLAAARTCAGATCP